MSYIQVICELSQVNKQVVVQVDEQMSAEQLIQGIRCAYAVPVACNSHVVYAISRYPTALLRGQKSLAAYGIMSGSIIYI